MPLTLPPRPSPGPRRRTLLASAAGALALAGCSSPDSSGGESPSAGDRARARAARDSETLAARYAAVITAHPSLAQRLRPLRAETVRHAKALAAGVRVSASPSPSGSATSPPGSPSASPSASAVPASEKDALSELATAERALADQRAKTLLDVPGELARLLASVAAAGAAHAYLLTKDGA
ncbi:hypothetical protein ACFV6E_26900 [Streptomyces sp. NPDC059785]|uniref:hypothetical protein n=1 Tax=Streptomyces sp. NPDC059785 TaxID=3346945 RepID=UPI003665BF68